MNQPTILFACAVLAAASSLVTSCEEMSFVDSYIDWTNLGWRNSEFQNETQQALLALNIEKCDRKIDIFAKILTGRSQSDGGHDYQVYDGLFKWSYYDDTCESSHTELVLEICSLMHDGKSLASFAQFLVPTGRTRFDQCRPSAVRRLSEVFELKVRYEKELDLFFAALLDLGEAEQTDHDKIKAAKTLSFVERNDLNVAAAVEVAKKSRWPESGDSFEIFDGFLSLACLQLKRGCEEAMNIIALANAFSYSPEFENEKVHKWQEYNRVCLTWTRPDMRKAAVPNIKQQLGAPSTETPSMETLALPEPQ